MAPLTSGYMSLIHASWLQLVKLAPSITQEMTFPMWQHIHKLFFSRRIEDARFKETGVKPSAANRSPVPSDLRIFQPIWDALITIGIYKDEATSARYIPTHPLPNSDKPEEWDHDFIIALSNCTAFDWQESWDKASRDLDRILAQQADGNVYDGEDYGSIPRSESKYTKTEIQTMIRTYYKYSFFQRKVAKTGKYIIVNSVLTDADNASELKSDEQDKLLEELKQIIPTATEITAPLQLDLTLSECLHEVRKAKEISHTYRPVPSSSIPALRFDFESDTDIGAYGKNLGWSPALWVQYTRAIDILSENVHLSLSFPNDKHGAPAWILQVKRNNGQTFCSLPTRLIPSVEAVLAVILDYASWDATGRSQYHSNWYTHSDIIQTVDSIRTAWILKGVKTPNGFIPVYT
jgi:hypothetical protein